MEFGLLGPLVVRHGGRTVPVPRGKQRGVLAALLLAANQVVPVDELTGVLWGQQPPPSAQVTVRNYIRRLRGTLGDAGRTRISTQPHGYMVTVAEGELDVSRFETLLNVARMAARDGSWDAAAGRAGEALAVWRGDALADVESDVLAMREIPRLAELRLQAVEIWADAGLRIGRHAEVTGELERSVAAHPLRERLHALLMLAHYRAGRPAESLAAYQHARRALISELGIEPGAELRELHQRILSGDVTLVAALPPEPTPEDLSVLTAVSGPELVVPRELPGAVLDFVGRDGELAALSGLAGRAGGRAPGTVVISAIGGTAGVGKTALAVQWAHQVADGFPDGQLYVNLRGYDPREPMTSADALAGFLGSLGVAGQDIPAGTDERVVRYRSLLSGRRMLIVLDNAREPGQVRPLLPGTPGCVTVVTSRDTLAGLVARDGALRVDLDLLSPADAPKLLRALIGDRAAADPGATQRLARACCYLPLALRVAAELAVARPDTPLAALADELTGLQRQLDLLDAGEDHDTSVRAVFSWSYRHLEAGAARAFRLAGLHPGQDFDRYAVAALTGATAEQAGQILGALARAHLIQPAGPARYGLHDLLRSYARELAAEQDTETARRAALTRLFDYYLHTASAAMDAVFPAERHRRPRIPSPGTPVPPIASETAARAWLDAERASLIAIAAYTADGGWPGYATRLSATLFRYLDTGSHFAEARILHNNAARAARHARDVPAEASALIGLGLTDGQQGHRQAAVTSLEQALALGRLAGDKDSQARALNYLANSNLRIGLFQEATDQLEQALALFHSLGERTGAAYALSNLGFVDMRMGNYQLAVSHHEQALAHFRELGDRHGEASVLRRLGMAHLRQNQYQQAIDGLTASLALFREFGDRPGEANALAGLGLAHLRQGRRQQAASHLQQALAHFHELGDRPGEAEMLNGLGETFLAMGRPADARANHTTALDLSGQVGEKPEQARAHNGLGNAYHALGDPDQARQHWQQALLIYTDVGAPEAGQVRARLATTHEQPQPPTGPTAWLLLVLQVDGDRAGRRGQGYGAGLFTGYAGAGVGDVADERGELEQDRAGGLLAGEGQGYCGAGGADGQPQVAAVGGGHVRQADDLACPHPRVGHAAPDDQGAVGPLGRQRVEQHQVGVGHAPGVRRGAVARLRVRAGPG
jgi:DNA-binding SARP family transcriptional activator/tetratricopeptide (TPR) repeat protein